RVLRPGAASTVAGPAARGVDHLRGGAGFAGHFDFRFFVLTNWSKRRYHDRGRSQAARGPDGR
ncbi:hypothetical protein, partial [Pseudooceanicola lipolyticus]|uniref:hypothetical protein n=1 Tax=Pseudooceanicola lipolyticus TaxID=2029104 RepID=UPI00197CCA60